MVKNIKQFRFYGTDNENNTNAASFFKDPGVGLNAYMPVVHIGVQTLPGTKIYLNDNLNPIIVGLTGIYELDLDNTTGLISKIRFDEQSINIINSIETAYLILDIVYETEED